MLECKKSQRWPAQLLLPDHLASPYSHRRELLADVCVRWDATHWAHLINAKWTADPTWPTNQSLFLGDLWLAGRDWTADPTWPIRASSSETCGWQEEIGQLTQSGQSEPLPRRPVVGRKRLHKERGRDWSRNAGTWVKERRGRERESPSSVTGN